jgi:hypothetical protein
VYKRQVTFGIKNGILWNCTQPYHSIYLKFKNRIKNKQA